MYLEKSKSSIIRVLDRRSTNMKKKEKKEASERTVRLESVPIEFPIELRRDIVLDIFVSVSY